MDELDELLKTEEIGNTSNINKKIKKRIRMRIVSIVCICALVVTSLYGIAYKGLGMFYYNPMSKPTYSTVDESNNYQMKDIYILLDKYFSIYYPGIVYFPDNYENGIENKGFGSYLIKGAVYKRIEPWFIGTYGSCDITITRGEVSINSTVSLTRMVYEYIDAGNEDVSERQMDTQSIIDEIKLLPDSAILDISLSFNERYSLQQTIDFIKSYPDSTFYWLATEMNNSSIVNGFSFSDYLGYELKKEYKEEYPDLYFFNEELTPELLTNHYLSTMKILIDNPDFMKVMQSSRMDFGIKSLEERYEEVKRNGVTTIGIRGTIRKKDILDMIDKGFVYFQVNDVKLSELSK